VKEWPKQNNMKDMVGECACECVAGGVVANNSNICRKNIPYQVQLITLHVIIVFILLPYAIMIETLKTRID
jgi:hypothetical protein